MRRVMSLTAITTVVAAAVFAVAPPVIGLLAVLGALTILVTAFWLSAVVELLKTGPGMHRDWWIACLIVVVVLGPLGALAYRIAGPSFDREGDESIRSR